jgi:iron(III) transport system ATP-binding protein
VETNGGSRLTACLPANVSAGEAVKIALRPENIRLGANGAAEPNTFTAQVAGTRYQGTQTVYELDMLGGRLDALELGTIVRYPVGSEIKVCCRRISAGPIPSDRAPRGDCHPGVCASEHPGPRPE